MKTLLLTSMLIGIILMSACKKDKAGDNQSQIPPNLPRTEVPLALRGMWMYGNFSTTEYWNRNPAEYLGNALTMAIAFKFNGDGTYEQYFTSRSLVLGKTTYQQSVTTGTIVIDPVNETFTTHPFKTHYRRTSNGQTLEERDLRSDEINSVKYYYETGVEANGTRALYLALDQNDNTIIFLLK